MAEQHKRKRVYVNIRGRGVNSASCTVVGLAPETVMRILVRALEAGGYEVRRNAKRKEK